MKKTYIYCAPHIHEILLDNMISLALESEPPTYESSNVNDSPEFFNMNIFKTLTLLK